MDLPQEAFEELEHALGQATFTFEHDDRVTGSSKHNTTHSSNAHPSAESLPVSPLSNDDQESFDVSITPPPDRHPELSRHNSGLPPTPPTTTHSDVAESKIGGSVSPVPRFADRVRNALESQRSGFSTPVVENHSPPTPDPSPRAVPPTLIVPEPLLNHQMSLQSHTESFQTATEGRSVHDSTSQVGLRIEGSRQQEEQKYLSTPKATRAVSVELQSGSDTLGLNDQSDSGDVRSKIYYMESDTDGERVRTKNYQAESDSDMERHNTTYVASDGNNTADESPTSPTSRNALDHRAAYQRLRMPIQPGDAIKRPDAALLYGSLPPKKLPNALDRGKTRPRHEMDTEFLRTSEVLAPSKNPELPKAVTPKPNSEPELVREMDSPQTLEMPAEISPKLREFAPSGAPPDPTPPTTAQKASLEENNIVYRIIREENAKRHSGISDGSVPAMVIPVPDHKRKLRHTQKRESLRGDASIEGNSKRSSSESGHKLKHKKALVGACEQNSAVNSSPGYVGHSRQKQTAARGSESDSNTAFDPGYVTFSQHNKTAMRGDVPNTSLNSGDVKFSARISRFAPGEDGFDYWSPIQYQELIDPKIEPRGSDTTAEPPLGLPKLRRSLRKQRLDRHVSVADSSEARPRSMDGSTVQQSTPSPKLRRSSQERRLEKSTEEKRMSWGREVNTMSQSIDTKLDLAAEDLTREGREMRDRMSTRERRNSSDRSFYSATSPRRKSFDPRYLHSVGTPYSTSQFSDRTEAEVLEARGIEIFPHNNESLLIIQNASQAISRPINPNEVAPTRSDPTGRLATSQPPAFEAYLEEPHDSGDEIGKPKYAVDSPLTNPRAAPEPPVIKFIPPTPNEELEEPLGAPSDGPKDPRKGMQRRLSLSQRVKRYSESLVQPLPFGRSGSVRKQEPKRVTTMPEARPTYLSSFWQPRDFWEEYDSEEDSDDYEPLPPGGDTSNVVDKRRSFLPRAMSKRMPGFRGQGGFLVGNSLGLDRHGTNNRRHYITKRTSEEMMRQLAKSKRRRTFTLPFSRGTKVEYVGLTGLSARMREMKQRRQTKALEKRRERLRERIGTRLYHDGRGGVP